MTKKRHLNFQKNKQNHFLERDKMQIERTLPDGKTKFIMEASSPKEAFIKLALIDDLFSEGECGVCKSKEIRFVNRKVDNGSYLEMRCMACRAQLSYGQNKEGNGIFLKKWDKENRCPMPNGGWYVYQQGGGRSDDHHHNQDPPQQQRRDSGMEAPPPSNDIPF